MWSLDQVVSEFPFAVLCYHHHPHHGLTIALSDYDHDYIIM